MGSSLFLEKYAPQQWGLVFFSREIRAPAKGTKFFLENYAISEPPNAKKIVFLDKNAAPAKGPGLFLEKYAILEPLNTKKIIFPDKNGGHFFLDNFWNSPTPPLKTARTPIGQAYLGNNVEKTHVQSHISFGASF